MLNKIRKIIRPITGTPFHPQWLAGGGNRKLLNYLKSIEEGKIILISAALINSPKRIFPIAAHI